MFGLRCAGQKGARGPAQLAMGELLKGSGKARGRDSKSTNAGQAPEPSRNERRCFNEVVKDLPPVFLNPTVVAAQDNRTAASGCLTIESARAVSELEWKPICMPSAFEHWSDAFDGPHDTSTTGRDRHALRNRESAGVERAGTQKRRTRVGLRDLLDPGAQHVASLFAGTEEQIKNRSRSRCPESWGKLRVPRILFLERHTKYPWSDSGALRLMSTGADNRGN